MQLLHLLFGNTRLDTGPVIISFIRAMQLGMLCSPFLVYMQLNPCTVHAPAFSEVAVIVSGCWS